jgi:hypothetical protein
MDGWHIKKTKSLASFFSSCCLFGLAWLDLVDLGRDGKLVLLFL